jgi:hypothetical protein
MLTRVLWFSGGLVLAAVPGLLFGLGMLHAREGGDRAAAAVEVVRGEFAAMAAADESLALLELSAVEGEGERAALESERWAALARASAALRGAEVESVRSRIGLWAWVAGFGSALAALPLAVMGVALAVLFDLRAASRAERDSARLAGAS